MRLHRVSHFTLFGALSGGFIGALAGLMLFNPILALIGLVAGSGIGAAVGALKEVGVDEAFMKQLASQLTPGSSALFILAKRADPARILDELKRYGGKVLQTSLTHENEAKLRSAIKAAERTAPATNSIHEDSGPWKRERAAIPSPGF